MSMNAVLLQIFELFPELQLEALFYLIEPQESGFWMGSNLFLKWGAIGFDWITVG